MPNSLTTLTGALLTAHLVFSPIAMAANNVAKVTHLSGLLTVKRSDGSTKVIAVKSDIQEGDTLITAQDTYARMKFVDGAEVVLRPGSQMVVRAYSFNLDKPQTDSAALNLVKGGFRAVTGLLGKRSQDNVSFTTNTATIGIRGTHFGAVICNNDCSGLGAGGKPPPNGLHVDVASGAVSVRNAAGQQQINSGQFGYVASPTTSPTVVPPQQGVVVAMPTAISKNKPESPVAKSSASGC